VTVKFRRVVRGRSAGQANSGAKSRWVLAPDQSVQVAADFKHDEAGMFPLAGERAERQECCFLIWPRGFEIPMASHTDPPAAEGGESARPRGMDTSTFRKDQSLHPVTDLSASYLTLSTTVH